jgi:ribosome-associated protein
VTNLQASSRNIRDLSLRREEDDLKQRTGGAEGRTIAMTALAAGLDRKALEPVLLDVRGLCSYTDYILLLSARSDRQVAAISDAVMETLKLTGNRALGVEGESGGQWTLIDFGDAVVHVFHHPRREYYDLESLWSDAPRVPIEVPDEARIRPDDPIY